MRVEGACAMCGRTPCGCPALDWPLPFEGELVDVDVWESDGRVQSESLPPIAASPKTAPILARETRAVSDRMECKHLLPPSQCAWCLNTKELVHEESWEKKDYVTTLDTLEPQGLDAEAEVPVGDVHPREIYGTQTALRIKHALERSQK